MTSVLTFDSAENPLVTAHAKQSEAYVVDLPSKEACSKLAIAAFYHGEACKSVIWSSNWQQTDGSRHTPGGFPTGFQFTVDQNAPVIAALFSAQQMYGTQMVFPLDAGARSATLLKSGAPLDDAHFHRHHDKMASALNLKLSDDAILS